MSAWMISSSSGKPAGKLSIYDIQASCKTTRERAAKPWERSTDFSTSRTRVSFRVLFSRWLLATPPNGELAHWLSSERWLISVRRVLFILQLITKFPAINVIKLSWRGSTPVSTVLTKSDTFFITNLFFIIKTLSKLKSGQYPKGITRKTRKGDSFILDPHLFSDNRIPSVTPACLAAHTRLD